MHDETKGNLTVTKFKCSKHGSINPKPVCPKCSEERGFGRGVEAIRQGTIAIGASSWQAHGEKYGYFDYFNNKMMEIEKGAIKMVGAVILELGNDGEVILPIGWELREGKLERETLSDGSTLLRAVETKS